MEKPDGLVTRRTIRRDEVLVKVSSRGVRGTDKGCIRGAGATIKSVPRMR